MQPVRQTDCPAKAITYLFEDEGTIMDEMGKWLLEVFTAINGDGSLGPPAATRKRVRKLLEEVGGERVLQTAALLKVGNMENMRKLANHKPDFGDWLKGSEPQQALDTYVNSKADLFEPFRNYVTRGLSLPEGNTMTDFTVPDGSGTGTEAWEKVFQILFGRSSDDTANQESRNL